MERKFNALSLKNVDYIESDKIVTLLTLERGKLVMRARGCRNAKAKLRCAVSPLCFGTYILIEKDNKFILKGCDIIETFHDAAENLDKYYISMIILEAADKFSEEGIVDEDFFVFIIKHLKDIKYEKISSLSGLNFLLDLLKHLGYAIALSEGKWFDYENGNFSKSASNFKEKLSEEEKLLFSAIIEKKEQCLECQHSASIKHIYSILDTYISFSTQKKMKTIREYLDII